MLMKEYGAHHRMQLARSFSGFALLPMLLPLQQLRVGCCRSYLLYQTFMKRAELDGYLHNINDIDGVDNRLDDQVSKLGWLWAVSANLWMEEWSMSTRVM